MERLRTESPGRPGAPGRADSQRWKGGEGSAPDQADPWLEEATAGREEPAGCDQGWAGEGGFLKGGEQAGKQPGRQSRPARGHCILLYIS